VSLTERERQQIYDRAGGRCECTADHCDRHPAGERCSHPLESGFWDVSRARSTPSGMAPSGALPAPHGGAARGRTAEASAHRRPGRSRKLSEYTAMCAACLEETAFALVREDDAQRRGESPSAKSA
jgi:hypothetical protein